MLNSAEHEKGYITSGQYIAHSYKDMSHTYLSIVNAIIFYN